MPAVAVNGVRVGPHATLAAAVLMTMALEALRGSPTTGTSVIWPVAEAAVAASALAVAWRRQLELKLPLVLGLGLALELGLIAVHLARGVHADVDSAVTYPREGNALLHGTYPSSEYPAGAVVLFAFEALVGGGRTRLSNALVMAAFQVAVIVAIWSLRTCWSAWLATVVALWPANAFFWEFKFDLAPAALLVLGLVCAAHDRWMPAGIALGLGAAVKWTPALTAAALAVWLIVSKRERAAAAHVGSAAAAFLVVNVPFLVWSPHQVLAAYRLQGGRGLTGESLPYIPLKLLGLARIDDGFWAAASVPDWANAAAVAVQGLALLGCFVIVATRGKNVHAAIATAAMAPVVFLIFNRVFSPQFLVLLAGAWAVAGSLLAKSRRDQLLFGVLILGATLSNTLVYPTEPAQWGVFSVSLFVFALAATAWVFTRAKSGTDPIGKVRRRDA
jgi:hypothetical protein